jgi:membrane protein implicated in regulation of membrane protease activity
MEGLDASSPIVGVVLGVSTGVVLVFSRFARGLPEPIRGLVRLELGDVSFTEVFGVFVLGYSIALLLSGPATPSSSGPPRPPGGRFVGGFNPLARAGLPVITGMLLAFLTILYRVDIIGRLTNPQSHNAVKAIIGAQAQAVEDIPAGGHGQITFRDPAGTVVGIMASAEVDISRGSRVRIVGTKGLNPLVVPEAPQT